MIDIYCERTSEGLLAEPLNLFTNLGFLIAAYLLFVYSKRLNKLNYKVMSLIVLITAIGIGSSLFHSFATKWAELADVVPIFIFQIFFLLFYLRDAAKLNWILVVIFIFGFLALSFILSQFPEILNGSLGYGSALIYLLGLSIYHKVSNKKLPFHILLATIVFIFSLTFRSLDILMCEFISFGTHFVWHILNSIMLYLLMKGLINNLE